MVSAARNELTQLLKDTTLIDDPVLANEVHIVSIRPFGYDTFVVLCFKGSRRLGVIVLSADLRKLNLEMAPVE